MLFSLDSLLPFSAIIFDCDGTLVDTVPAHLAALQGALELRGLHMEAKWYHDRHSFAAYELLMEFEREGLGIIPDKSAVLDDHQRLFSEHLHLVEEIQLVTETARQWSGKVPLGVASNGHRPNVVATLNVMGITGLFNHIVTREDVENGKPAPDLYLEAARRLGVEPEKCVVLEDADAGVQAAESAGAKVLDIRNWHTPRWRADFGHR